MKKEENIQGGGEGFVGQIDMQKEEGEKRVEPQKGGKKKKGWVCFQKGIRDSMVPKKGTWWQLFSTRKRTRRKRSTGKKRQKGKKGVGKSVGRGNAGWGMDETRVGTNEMPTGGEKITPRSERKVGKKNKETNEKGSFVKKPAGPTANQPTNV